MPTCPACGQENPEGARFCNACAAVLSPERTGLREERKLVSVLFADLAGFTKHAERLDPEDVRALLAAYHEGVRTELERYGGTVEKFIGDAVMALFGAPSAHEDDAERAVRAGVAIRKAIAELNERDPLRELHVRIGITTGEALISLWARPLNGQGMAAGDVVNTAARLQSAAPTDGILVDESTYRATRKSIEFGKAQLVEVKGKREPIRVWEVLRLRPELRIGARPSSHSPLVGRERELDVLRDVFVRSRQEREPQLVTLIGVPGIGKSRLVLELVEAAEQDPELGSWRQGRSLPYGEGVTFWALAEIVKAEAGILETDAEKDAAAKLAACVSALVHDRGEAAWVEAHLRPLVGVRTQTQLPSDRREEAFAAWRRFFEAAAEKRSLVAVFEDLHWADDNVLDFIDHLVEWAGGVPLFVVCTARPELLASRPGWGGGKPNATTLSLSPLSDEETATLAQALLTRTTLRAELQSALLEHAGGNPLYAEEFARAVLDTGRFVTSPDLPLPESVQGIIAARLDLLPADEKTLLQDAAVVGKVFWLGALASIGDSDRWMLETRLHLLERKEFVRRERRSAVANETEYTFRHLLVKDVAYGQIPRAARAEKHRRAAAWIESLGRREDHAEMLAHHYSTALEYARAARQPREALSNSARVALRDAGDRAAALNAFAAAARFYTRALDLSSDDDAERPHLLYRLGKAQFEAGEADGEILRRARDELLAFGHRATGAEAEVMLGMLQWLSHGKRADENFGRAEALVAELPPSRAKAYVMSEVARFHALAEDDRAIAVGREAAAIAEHLRLDEIHAQVLSTVGRARVDQGDSGGLADLERSVKILTKLNAPEVMRAYSNLANAFVDLGDLAQAFELQARRRRAAERFGNSGVLRTSRAERAEEDYWGGRWDDALEGVEHFIAEAEAGAPHMMEVLCRKLRARIRSARGNTEAALCDVFKALDLVRHAYPGPIYPVHSACAAILLSVGRLDEAAALADEVLSRWSGRTGDWVADLAIVLSALGRGGEFLVAADRAKTSTRWLEASARFVSGEFERSAVIYAEIGSRPDEAFARLRCAERLVRDGRRGEADAQLEQALAFYGSVGATSYIRECEGLLVASS